MLQLINYSEKAIAVTGDTRDHKDELKAAGGRFNAKLSCGAGWIFSKKAVKTLEAIIAKANGGETPKSPEKGEDNPLKGARVYVGTYAKYNAGSLEGKWLSLEDYANKAEFIAACLELHKDEADPELMFQDWEGVPSWMIGESHIDPEVWEQKPEAEPKGVQTKAEIRALLEKALVPGRDLDHYVKGTAIAVEVEGRVFAIDKPEIETRFCHPDEPAEAVEAWRKVCRTWEYFRDENLAGIDRKIKSLEEGRLGYPLQLTGGEMGIGGLFVYKDFDGLWNFGTDSDRFYITKDSEATAMDEETRGALLKAYKAARVAMEKRLATWWKRYGADKLHCWTYWQDA